MPECTIDGEICGGLCTGFDGSDIWQQVHALPKKLGCETCKDEGGKLFVFSHDIVNARLGKPIYDEKNFAEFIKIVNCIAAKLGL